jgi:putative toxin-antitoxin system antitoxin component (TIGR02293 family)
VLTEEQKNEIQQEVARLFERLGSTDWFSKADDPFSLLWAAASERSPIPSTPLSTLELETDAALERMRERMRAQLARFADTPSRSQPQPLEPLVRVIARAVEVLGTSEKALRWINAPVRSLGNQTPASLLDSPGGIKRVEDSLGRIEHGVW